MRVQSKEQTNYLLYDLGNEKEKEFFAAVDLEYVNVSDKVD